MAAGRPRPCQPTSRRARAAAGSGRGSRRRPRCRRPPRRSGRRRWPAAPPRRAAAPLRRGGSARRHNCTSDRGGRWRGTSAATAAPWRSAALPPTVPGSAPAATSALPGRQCDVLILKVGNAPQLEAGEGGRPVPLPEQTALRLVPGLAVERPPPAPGAASSPPPRSHGAGAQPGLVEVARVPLVELGGGAQVGVADRLLHLVPGGLDAQPAPVGEGEVEDAAVRLAPAEPVSAAMLFHAPGVDVELPQVVAIVKRPMIAEADHHPAVHRHLALVVAVAVEAAPQREPGQP